MMKGEENSSGTI